MTMLDKFERLNKRIDDKNLDMQKWSAKQMWTFIIIATIIITIIQMWMN